MNAALLLKAPEAGFAAAGIGPIWSTGVPIADSGIALFREGMLRQAMLMDVEGSLSACPIMKRVEYHPVSNEIQKTHRLTMTGLITPCSTSPAPHA